MASSLSLKETLSAADPSGHARRHGADWDLHGTRKKIEASAGRVEDSADRRTILAANRTVFAAERTYAAWVRTALVALASGVGAKATLHGVVPEWIIVLAGSVLVLFSAFCFEAAVWREIDTGAGPPHPEVRRVPRPLLIAVNLLLGLVSLAALDGIWFGQSR